ncbi:conserved hypothetical protein [Acinetobacter proteolyticus]|jgi:hypothetical protein|uniref:SGNH hydrolase-type esterase domain-containing protein n=1 Tax=Acinetobacter proteolyticus TaxID=1776741 RepID=A0A653K9P8_9GAMM|nr:SGNH/GDSL hydrolase family protein [Acinetobacter proteolyticus]VXA57504.1 conserved hypothetical protein [Acinetobacter proteolyticus]
MAELPNSDEFINPNTTEAQFKAALKVLVENVSSLGYVDSFLKTVKTLPSGSTTAARTLGFHILPTSNTYTGLPPNIIHDDTIVIQVVQATGVFYDQVLYKLSARHRVWVKSIRVSDGSGTWRNPVNRYQGAYDNIDPMTLTEDGTYVLTNGKNLPSGFSGSAILDLDRAGGFTTRIIKQTNDSSKKWEKTEGEAWKEAMPFALTNNRFPSDYNFRGLFTDADIDTLISEGNHLVNGIYQNGPPFIPGTLMVKVEVYGAFRIQTARGRNAIGKIGQRSGFFSSGSVVWDDLWEDVTANSGGSSAGSSLNGKVIANIGDSITEQGDWIERLCERYGATPLKFGFGGCRMGRYESNMLGYNLQCMYNIAKCINTGDFSSVIAGAEYTRDNHNDDNTPQANALAAVNWNAVDILVISFGTNDWNGNPLGTSFIADPTGATFKGALCYVIEQIQSKYPHLQLVFVGMSYRLKTGVTDPAQNSDDEPSTYGYLYEYQQAILEAAAKYHLPAYDFYKNSGVNRYTYTHYLRDGVHPKPISGYQHWANKIGSFLNSVI